MDNLKTWQEILGNVPVPKSLLMKRLRSQRKSAGLIAVTVYVLPEHREAVKRYADNLK